MNDLLQKVKKTVSAHCLLQRGDHVLVALSGGADSVCLLLILTAFAREMDLSLAACHVHHGLRGAEADEDASFTEALCQKFRIPFFLHHVDVRCVASELNMSLEEAGRNVRYAYFKKLQQEHGFTKIATAHHRDDNIETVLMRMLRGTSPVGMGGIPYENHGVIRPLLDVSRHDIENYLKEQGQSYRVDSTNEEQEFTRNQIRLHLLPLLEQKYNPNFRSNFQEQIAMFVRLGAYLKDEAEALFSRLAEKIQGGFSFSCDELLARPEFLVEQMLYQTLAKLLTQNQLNNKHLLSLMELLQNGQGKLSLPEGFVAEICHGTLYLHKPALTKRFCYEVIADSEIFINEINMTFTCHTCDSAPEIMSKDEVFLDVEMLGNQNLVLRSRQDGDYFYFDQSGKKKKLQDFFVDEKVPRFQRDSVPLLAVDNEIIWIGGYRLGYGYQMKCGQKQGLCIKLHKEERP